MNWVMEVPYELALCGCIFYLPFISGSLILVFFMELVRTVLDEL